LTSLDVSVQKVFGTSCKVGELEDTSGTVVK
jgi:hypothetical protein